MNKYLDYAYASLPLFLRNKIKRFLMYLLERRLKLFYSQFIDSQSLVFDIGSNDGDYAQVFESLGKEVICLEPHPQYAEKLKRRFLENKKVVIIKKGVGKKIEKKKFFISSFNGPNSTYSTQFMKKSRYNYRKWDKQIVSELTTLDQLIKDFGKPDFCKIDVEGYELEIIEGLHEKIPCLSFEFLSELNGNTSRIVDHLNSLGKCEYNFCLNMSYSLRLNSWVSGEKLLKIINSKNAIGWGGDIYVRFS